MITVLMKLYFLILYLLSFILWEGSTYVMAFSLGLYLFFWFCLNLYLDQNPEMLVVLPVLILESLSLCDFLYTQINAIDVIFIF